MTRQPSRALSKIAPRTEPRAPDVIGIGAQRTGSSWIYACMYEHPEICMPRKEINFFSRERNWSKGFDWYEDIFAECAAAAICGEFSTSYLPDPATPRRIHDRYPEVRLIVSLRHPAERAYSSYLNDILAGVVSPEQSFPDALIAHPEYIDGSRYGHHLSNFLDCFNRDQVLVLMFDDARREPLATVRQIYRFLDVDPEFRPAMLDRPVSVGRIPRSNRAERSMLALAEAFRHRRALRPVWWMAKKSGIGDRIRALNTRNANSGGLDPEHRRTLMRELEPDVTVLEDLLGLELSAWRS
jgi:Sulfotransferase domain